MFVSVIISLLIGIVLGRRCTVLILAPAFTLTLVVAIGTGLARTDAAWSIGLTSLVVIGGLQIGYLLGCGMHHLLVLVRANRPGSESFANSQPPHRPAH